MDQPGGAQPGPGGRDLEADGAITVDLFEERVPARRLAAEVARVGRLIPGPREIG
jgi:hypothetical protein